MNGFIPEVKAGQPLSAKWLNQVVARANRFSGPAHSFQTETFQVTRPVGVGGEDVTSVVAASQFAKVTAQAARPVVDTGEYGLSFILGPLDAGDIGKATLLYYTADEFATGGSGVPYFKLGAEEPLGEYDEYTSDQEIWIWCMNPIATMEVGDIVEIQSRFAIEPGLYVNGDPEQGRTYALPAKHVNPNEFYHNINGGGIPNKVLFSDDGHKSSQRWAGKDCAGGEPPSSS
jgi:hypothetical protein